MPDPISRFRSAFRAAVKAGAPIPESMAMASVGPDGKPSVRYLLLKEAGPKGFVFYTNANSRKGRELASNANVALAFYWDATGKQVRVEGKVRELDARSADEYWAQRPLGSRYASAASEQSAPIASRTELMKRYRALEKRYPGGDIPRPTHWKGYLLEPVEIEFWTRAEPRLHKRELFRRTRSGWKMQILQP